MAEIRTAINVVDGFTPVFKSLTSALNLVTNSLISTQSQFSKSIDVSSLNVARDEIAKVSAQIDAMGEQAQQSAVKQETLNASMDKGTTAASSLIGKVKGLVAAYMGFQGVKTLLGNTDTFGSITAMIGLMNKGGESVDSLKKKIFDMANATGSSFNSVANAVASLGIQAGKAFGSNDEILDFVDQINKNLAISGTAGTAAAEGAMLQFTQAMSKGVLRGAEWISVQQGIPTLANAIKQYFVDIGDNRAIADIAEKGQITADVIKKAMANAADDTNKKFLALGTTFGQVWNIFSNYADDALTSTYQYLSQISNSKEFQNFAIDAGKAFGVLGKALAFSLNLVSTIYTFVKNNWSLIAPIFWGIVAALTAYYTYLGYIKAAEIAGNVIKVASTVASLAYAAATGTAAAATTTQTAAQLGLNAALLACPITWIVAAVIAVIAVIYLAVAAVNKLAGTSYSATGLIAGAFTGLYTIIFNAFAQIWNTVAAFIEFFINAFNHPIYSIKKLFVNFATNFIDLTISMIGGWDKFATSLANAFISAINSVIGVWNKFIDLLPTNVTKALGLTKRAELSQSVSITSDLTDAKKRLQALVADQPADYISLDKSKLQYRNIREYAQKGYNEGAKFAEDPIKYIKGLMPGTDEIADLTQQGAKSFANALANSQAQNSLNQIAANTKKTADKKLTIDSEELKYLREIGERDVINRFTTSEIKMEVKNNNNFSSTLDIDAAVEYLTNKLKEAAAVTANGTHS